MAALSRSPLLTVPEAASALAVSISTVRRLIRDGDLPTVRIRAALRIRAADIDALTGHAA